MFWLLQILRKRKNREAQKKRVPKIYIYIYIIMMMLKAGMGSSTTIAVWFLLLLLLQVGATKTTTTTTTTSDSTPTTTSTTTNNDQSRKKTKEDYLVTKLQNIEPAYDEFDGQMYSGLIPIDDDSVYDDNDDDNQYQNNVGETMFWMFEPTHPKVVNTIVVWLNGGPGCSSFNCGVLMEHSPVTQPLHDAGYCCINTDQPPLATNQHTWTRATTMLYVEHPIGTGFSYGRYPNNEWEASQDFYIFLQRFYQIFDHIQSYQLYIMGESYAGMFVPMIGQYIHEQNTKIKNRHGLGNKESSSSNQLLPINLQGLGIGNGWMNGYVQGPEVIDYSWYHGLIDEPTRNTLKKVWDQCMEIDKHESKSSSLKIEAPFHDFNVQDDCGMMWGVLEAAGQPNAYDITTWDPNVDQITFSSEAFYNNPKVKEALHAPTNITWHGCQVGSGRRRRLEGRPRKLYMDNDEPVNVVPYVAKLLDAGIRTVIYNGDRDMTTNMVGAEKILNDMEWNGSGKDKWWNAPRGLWKVNNYPAGWAKEYKELTFVVVYNSGHMVSNNVH